MLVSCDVHLWKNIYIDGKLIKIGWAGRLFTLSKFKIEINQCDNGSIMKDCVHIIWLERKRDVNQTLVIVMSTHQTSWSLR